MGRVIAAAAYSAGHKITDITVEESGEWAARPGHFVWIGIEAPNKARPARIPGPVQAYTSLRSRTRSTRTKGPSSRPTATPPSWSCALPS